MARKKKPAPTESEPQTYEYVRAIVDCGRLRWEYQVKGLSVPGRLGHDEDVSDWNERDIRNCTRQMLDIPSDQDSVIEVQYR